MIFFLSQFLRECPLHYAGNRGSGALNVMGAVMLSVLAGHWRYTRIYALRGDGINPGCQTKHNSCSKE